MNRINQYGIEPGVWKHVGTGALQVVTEIVTHQYDNGEMKEVADPVVVYRDLIISAEKHISYSMPLTEFKQKFTKA